VLVDVQKGVCRAKASLLAVPQVPFRQTVEGLLPRPWAVDNLDAALDALTRPHPHTHAICFADNAGSDAVLGVHKLMVATRKRHGCLCTTLPVRGIISLLRLAGILPFARELLRRGTRVSLAANETPSINDITAAELQQVWVPGCYSCIVAMQSTAADVLWC
jgi:damage-control phosphatase, subfamily II, stand-alone protein